METVNYGYNKFYDTGPQEAKYASVFVPEKPLILVGKVSNLPQREAPKRCSSRVGSVLNCKYQTRLDRFYYSKFTSLFSLFVNEEEKSFITMATGVNVTKLFFFVISIDKIS